MAISANANAGTTTVTITWSQTTTKMVTTVDNAVRQLQRQGFSAAVGVNLTTAANQQKLNILEQYLRQITLDLSRAHFVQDATDTARTDAEALVGNEIGINL